MLDKVEYLFELQDAFVVAPCSGNAFQVVMLTKNNTEKVVKLSNDCHLISGRMHPESIENTVHNVTDFSVFRGKMMIDKNFLMNNFLHISGTDGIVFQKSVSVKNNTLLYTILRNSAVLDAAVYKNDISGCRCEAFFV